ncbi:deoxycytidylate deaminase [Arthrobacter phage Andrew]|uniref:Deoxycytidylate deaminase n=1 Tax=Arthrobacter phage Andrew TaxID=2419946 RepID=A0A3G2KD11_9CAUD|nr:deoxycytidylate deaminase [Arthrobacter phage Andrew]AYN56869.1 deoxycytidylate deaminase [Arthrobacter phage Andrew]
MSGALPVLYLCGPMTGLPDFNYPAFNSAARLLRRRGFEVLNPAENKLAGEPGWCDYMKAAIGQLVRADALAVLPGADKSRGAGVETRLAIALGMEVRAVRYWLTKQEQDAYMARLQTTTK